MNIQTIRFSQKISEIKRNLWLKMLESSLYIYICTFFLLTSGAPLYLCFDAWVSMKYIFCYYIYILKIVFYCLQMLPLPIGESLNRMWFIANIIAGDISRNNQNAHILNEDNEID